MSEFSKHSQDQLLTCHPDLQKVLVEAKKYYNFEIIIGHRGKEDQDKAVAEGKSTTPFPKSKHNVWPSRAADLFPAGAEWNDTKRFAFMMGALNVVAQQMGVKVRFGIDFNQNGKLNDDKLYDGPHIELL